MWWVIGCVCNAVIALAYLLISVAIAKPLMRSKQLRSNPLGAATAAIFFTCAVHHGAHTLHMLMPFFGIDEFQGHAMRNAWGWQLALWDVVGAGVATYYWSLRRNYGSMLTGAKLFEDLRQREQQALEINDNVLQGLVVARMALDLDQRDKAVTALDTAIGSASHIITELLANDREVSAGLLRSSAALLGIDTAKQTVDGAPSDDTTTRGQATA
jgi:hypothetical protein